MAPCCTCNGKNAACKRCVCVRSGRPCVSCLPLRERCCVNTLQHRQRPLDGFVKKGVHDKSDNSNGDHTSVGSVADFDVNTSSQVPTNRMVFLLLLILLLWTILLIAIVR